MLSMIFFATTWSWNPSLNPLGLWSVTAALISAAAWLLTDHPFLKSERARGWLSLLLPILLLLFVAYSKVHVDVLEIGLVYDWRDWRFHTPDAQNFFADYIFIAVSIVLARKAARLPAGDLRIVGFAVFAAAVLFLALEICMLFQSRYKG